MLVLMGFRSFNITRVILIQVTFNLGPAAL